MDKIKLEIQKIEAGILAITGSSIDDYNEWAENGSFRKRVESLLKRRCELLNDAFQLTAENLDRISKVNEYLTSQTKRAYDRIIEVDYFVDNYMMEYEDEYREIESRMRFIFRDEESVVKLDDDEYYGSNFTLMIKALTDLYMAKGQENIIYARDGKRNPDDGDSWLDDPFFKWKDSLNDIIICYAVHDLTAHKTYSVPDLLRLNSFQYESAITFQSINCQNGSRIKE